MNREKYNTIKLLITCLTLLCRTIRPTINDLRATEEPIFCMNVYEVRKLTLELECADLALLHLLRIEEWQGYLDRLWKSGRSKRDTEIMETILEYFKEGLDVGEEEGIFPLELGKENQRPLSPQGDRPLTLTELFGAG